MSKSGIRYLVLIHEVEDDGSTGQVVEGEKAIELGERLGIGRPSDPDDVAIWYMEA